MQEAIYRLANGYLHIQESSQASYEYTIFDNNKRLKDGGFWDTDAKMSDAAKEIAEDNSVTIKELITSNDENNYEDIFETFIF